MRAYITIDTEFSPAMFQKYGETALDQNFRASIEGETQAGAVGIGYQMDVLERYGLKGVFFVDPMPSLVWGTSPINRMVKAIVTRGHDVQLHLHTEWLQFAAKSPVRGNFGRNIGDFNFADQATLLEFARDRLVEAGAPAPVCFRAGNFGANDLTLDALASIGMLYDTSFNPAFLLTQHRITLPESVTEPVSYRGVVEVPVSAIRSGFGNLRPTQITALSWTEMRAAIRFAMAEGQETFTIVSHSFELLSRDRQRINLLVRRRFHRLCAWLANTQGVTTGTYRDNPPQCSKTPARLRASSSAFQTMLRLGEQWISNHLYGAE